MNNVKENKTKNISVITTLLLVILITISICSQYIFTGVYIGKKITSELNEKKPLASSSTETTTQGNNQNDPNAGEYLRLSNTRTENSIPYRSESHVGWGQIRVNQDGNGNKITVKRGGTFYPFDNGIWAHATSNIYYDISQYSEKYPYLTLYIGMNQTSSSGNGAKVWIYTSNEDEFHREGSQYWTLQNAETDANRVIMPKQDAVFEKVDIRGAKYLRIQAYDNGSNASDHIVYVDPMIITENYQEEKIEVKRVEEYDKEIKNYSNKTLSDSKFELLLLQREFVNNIGEYALDRFIKEDSQNIEVIEWLMNDLENMQMYILGGKPEGNQYLNSLKILKRFYNERKEDLEDTTEINTNRGKTTLGKMYKTMAFACALTHCNKVYLWINGGNVSDPIERYDIYKKLYHGKVVADDRTTKGIGQDLIQKTKFASLTVEEMRWVMNTIIDNEEIEWLNWFAREIKNGAVGPYSYQAYTFGYNYGRAQYYSQENYNKWDTKYNLKKYNITYKSGNPKLWIVFEEGSVCGGLSKTGSCVWGSFKGLPNTCVSQPGHCAYIYYDQDANGNGIWGLGNDVGGWHQAGRTEHLNVRMPLEWGNEEYIDFNKDWLGMATYVLLSQGALNQYDNYRRSREILILADVYKDDFDKLYEIYKKSIEALPINIDTWYGLIKTCRSDERRTEEDFNQIGRAIFEKLKYYPLPMYHLAREVQKQLKSPQYVLNFVKAQTEALTKAKNATASNTLQLSAVRQEATHLLGQIDTQIAKFSFDGENAGKIILGDRFTGSDVAWDYSLDGRETWSEQLYTEAGKHSHKLTEQEIESITAEKDIYVHITGVDYSDQNVYQIDIQESAGLPSTVYPSDLENRVLDVNLSTEWRYKETDDWTKYSEGSPDLTGNKTVQLRQGATGTRLASKQPVTYTFTEDTDTEKRKYIPISHLKVKGCSSEAVNNGGSVRYAIDANLNTRWHSAWDGSDTQRYIIVELDKLSYISAVEYVPAGGGNGKIFDGTIWGSTDGENWEVLTSRKNLSYKSQTNSIAEAIAQTQAFEIAEPKEVKYVKIVADNASTGHNMARNGKWFTARAFNFYEDLTKNPELTAGIEYSTTEKTNEPVIARLVKPSSNIIITNNNGNDSYVFTENGEFTFEFEDENKRKGTATAKVDWIDKSGPEVDVEYKLGEDKKLIAIIDDIDEDVYLLDKNNKKTNYLETQNGKVVSISFYNENEEVYKIAEIYENKNTKKITYKNTTDIKRIQTYEITLEDGKVVTRRGIDESGNSVELEEDEINKLKVLEESRANPLEVYLEENEEYEFKFLDKASNITVKNVKVEYIENDTKILASDITYSTTMTTNQDVKAVVKPYIIDINGKGSDVKVINNKSGSTSTQTNDTYTFTKNGEFTFEYVESAKENNPAREVGSHTASVDWIDKVVPTAEIEFSTKENAKDITVTLTNESEAITIINNGGKREYTFTENGEFTFQFQDKAGNQGTATATVNWLKDIVGDIDGDREVTINDLAMAKLHFLDIAHLTGEQLERADLDKSGEVEVNDIAQLKLIILGLI